MNNVNASDGSAATLVERREGINTSDAEPLFKPMVSTSGNEPKLKELKISIDARLHAALHKMKLFTGVNISDVVAEALADHLQIPRTELSFATFGEKSATTRRNNPPWERKGKSIKWLPGHVLCRGCRKSFRTVVHARTGESLNTTCRDCRNGNTARTVTCPDCGESFELKKGESKTVGQWNKALRVCKGCWEKRQSGPKKQRLPTANAIEKARDSWGLRDLGG